MANFGVASLQPAASQLKPADDEIDYLAKRLNLEANLRTITGKLRETFASSSKSQVIVLSVSC